MINSLRRRLVLIICIVSCLHSAHSATFSVFGVEDNVSENVLSRLTELYEKDAILKEPAKEIKNQVEKAMYPYGYFKPKVELRHEGNHVNIYITPGPQMHITSLSVKVTGEGSNNARIQKVLHNLPIKVGQALNNTLYQDAKDDLFSAAEHEGYLRATFVTAQMLIDRKHDRTDITLVFDTGPQFYFGQVRFDPTHISPKLLARYIPFHYGHPYSTDDVLALESNLSASGYFKSVVIKPDINGKQYVPMEVHLQEVNRTSYSLGIGYGTDTGPRGRAQLSVIPVNRAGHKFNAIAQGSMKQNTLLAQYLIPGRNPVTDNYSITGSVSNFDYSSGHANSGLLTFAQQHIKKNHQRILSLNVLHERFQYTLQPNTTTSLLYPRATLTWRKTSDPLFSPSGYNVTLMGFAAAQGLLSDTSLAQGQIDAKAAYTFDAIRTRLFFHTIQGVTFMDNIYQLPLSLSFLLGGAENLKAYSFNAIGPGKTLTYAGLEIQKETKEKWYLIGFLDAGDVYRPSPKAFKYDVGVGLMWVSPVGPIKIGVAQAVNRDLRRVDGQNPKLVINMGPDL